jgi:Uma2 family endonuclease
MVLPSALRFTYSDYKLLPEDRRYEVIEGELRMTPAPTTTHQRISRNVGFALHVHVSERSLGEVLQAPCDVVLSETDVVQPDILFVSRDRSAIVKEAAIEGAPDLVVEILSPATATRDRVAKAKLYARHGVRELWLVDPGERSLELHVNEGEGFRQIATYGESDTLRSPLLPDFTLPLARVF